MKVSRLFTIDVEIAEKLRNIDNASSLVNQLLRDHLEVRAGNNNIADQKKAIASNLKKKMFKIRKEIKIFDQLEAIGFDNFCIKFCQLHDNPDVLLISKYIRGRNLNIKTEDFKKGYDLIKKNEHLFEKA